MDKLNIEDVVLFQIEKTSKISKIYSQKEFDRLKLGITVDQWILLKIIHENSAISQNELATKSYRDPASITRTLDILQKRAFVNREAIPGNRRKYSIILTKQGIKFININMSIIDQHRKKSMNNIKKYEVQILSDLLNRIQNNMK